jgi:AcrR family transcriptional regulator
MARPPKNHQIRINEILDAAATLFYSRGYHQTMISDIVGKIGMAQGSFYYYFKSKEEIVEALIKRHLSGFLDEIAVIAASDEIEPPRKIDLVTEIILNTMSYRDKLLLEFLYNDEYMHLVDKMVRQIRKLQAPYMLSIIEEGNRKKFFNAPYPKVSIRVIELVIQCHMEAVYEKKPEEVLAYQWAMGKTLIEKALGLPGGTLQGSADSAAAKGYSRGGR